MKRGVGELEQRFYASQFGRFMSADRLKRRKKSRSSQSWNKYVYAGNDPVNRNDPKGLCDVVIGGITNSSSNSAGISQFATSIGALQVFPYADGSGGGLAGVAAGLGAVASQSLFGANEATLATVVAILTAAQNAGPINIFTFSGGAQAYTTALQYLPASVTSRINNVTYLSPGVIGTLPSGSTPPTVIFGAGGPGSAIDVGVQGLTNLPPGSDAIYTGCGHNANCEIAQTSSVLRQRAGSACSSTSTFSTIPGGGVSQVGSSMTTSSISFGASDDDDDDDDDDDGLTPVVTSNFIVG